MHAAVLLLPLLSGAIASPHSPAMNHRRHHNRVEAREFGGAGRTDGFFQNAAAETQTGVSSLPEVSASSTVSNMMSSSTSGVTSSTTMSSASQSTSSSSSPEPSTSASTETSTSSFVDSSTSSSVAPSSSAAPTSSATSAAAVAATNSVPTTVSLASTSSVQQIVGTPLGSSSAPALVTTVRSTASSAATSASSANSSSSTSGLSKPAMIAIIVCSILVALGIAWTLFRRWKLRPSSRFDSRLKAIDFGPGSHDDGLYNEKSHHRSNSTGSTARQRNLLAAEVDTPTHVAGVPEHDFTAPVAHHGGYPQQAGVHDMYNQDPYYHAEAYEYESAYQNGQAMPAAGYAYGQQADYPTQDQPITEGYADLQRGNSGSSHGHHGVPTATHGAHTHVQPHVYPDEFPSPDSYLGRPTGGNEGPYAQAAQYRAY